MSYGTQQWGLDGFGGLSADLSISHAYAISTNEVVVVLSKPPLDRTALLTGDVRSPGSWRVTIPATNTTLTVAGVAQYAAPLSWLIRTLDKLPESTVTCLVEAVGLKDANNAIVGSLDSAEFAGVTELAVSTPAALAATRQASGRDLANVPTPTVDAGVGGTLLIKGGDYALVEGSELLKKLILRRLVSAPNDFFHLPNYGVGLKVKQAIPTGDLVKLKTRAENQVKLEKGVGGVSVAVAQSNNTLTVQVKAKLAKSGQVVTVAMGSPIGEG